MFIVMLFPIIFYSIILLGYRHEKKRFEPKARKVGAETPKFIKTVDDFIYTSKASLNYRKSERK